jgi:hypothetical protein
MPSDGQPVLGEGLKCSESRAAGDAYRAVRIGGLAQVLTIEAIVAKYGVVITGDTDEEVIVLYLEDLEDMPVGSIEPRNEDAVSTDEKSKAEPVKEQETIASRVVMLEPPSAIGGEVADDATTGPTARRIPAAAEPVDDTRTIE